MPPQPQTANQRAVYRRRVSTVPLALAYLHDTVLQPNLAVTVSYGPPREVDIGPQIVMLGDADLDDDWSQLGDGARDETYTVDLLVQVDVPGGTQRQATEAAYALLGQCDQLITADRTLGGLVFSALVRFRNLRQGLAGDGTSRRALIRSGIRIHARI